ncbi:MAG TPA: hypothetical protein VKF42_05925 [Chitinivibrionales bacterium]|jgi:hypothetical protein|nr:hypothetical protein [Chitinivibrionales bacterium]
MTPAYGIGIENLQILRSGAGGDEPNVNLATLAESWVSNIASVQTSGTENYAHVMLTNDYACEVRDSWFQGGGVNGSGLDYGVYIVNNASENLVENNVFVGMRHSMIIAAGASGNVYGYNYTSGPWESNYPNDQTGDQDSHGGETYMNLWEGNIAENFWMDNTWGGNAFNTGFRDWCIAYSTAGQNDQDWNAIALEANTYSANVVGMVLGRPGAANIDYSLDSGARSTAFIQGNYSFQTGKTLWISGPVTLPASLYYSSKPAWWGTLAWPAIGPDVSPVNGVIPAQQRFLVPVKQLLPQSRNATGGIPSAPFLKSTIIPKSGATVLTFGVPVAGDVALEIYSLSGRTVATISKPGLAPGIYEEHLGAAVLPAGVYCCKLRVGTAVLSHVMQVAR